MLAIRRTVTIGAVIDAVVAGFGGLNETIAADSRDTASRRAAATRNAILVAEIASFTELSIRMAVPTAGVPHTTLGAVAIATNIDAIIALLAARLINIGVAAVGIELARATATAALSIGVAGTVIAFLASRNDAITATGRELTPGAAGTSRGAAGRHGGVLAVVTLLRTVLLAVTAEGSEFTFRRTTIVESVTVGRAVVAFLTGSHGAITAVRLADG